MTPIEGHDTPEKNNRAANSKRGLKAKNSGKAFEEIFEAACLSVGVACTRIPDGCKQIGPKKLMRVKSPWDYVITHKGRTALLDTKSTSHTAFRYSDIDERQVKEMAKHESFLGTIGGYVIWIRGLSSVIFVPARILEPLIGQRGSISIDAPGVTVLGELTESPREGYIALNRLFSLSSSAHVMVEPAAFITPKDLGIRE